MSCPWRMMYRVKKLGCLPMRTYAGKDIIIKNFATMEMNQETLDKMRQMRLLGMYNAFRTSMDSFKVESMTTDQFVSWLVTNEWDERCNRMIERLIKQANFRYKAYMEEMDYSIERGLDRNLLERLAELTFVREGKDLSLQAVQERARVI